MKGKHGYEIHYSPSLEIENRANLHALSFSEVGDRNLFAFYIFYKRPETIKTLFGLFERIADEYSTDVTGQTKQNDLACLPLSTPILIL